MTTHLAKVTGELRAIPRERMAQKIKRLLLAAGLIVLLVYVAIPKGWPVGVQIALAVAAGYYISADLTGKGLKFIVAAVRDMVNAIAGKNGTREPPAQ